MRIPGDSVDDFEELRRLLLSREQAQLREVRDRVANKEKRARDVSGVLPQAVKLSQREELSRALQPAVEESIRESVEKRPHILVDAFHPIIGPMVRRSIAETLRGLMQSLNQTLEHTFSWRGLKWRWEALRTGKSFAEVVMLRSLLYRVEQVLLLHRETGLPLVHVAANLADAENADMLTGMLTAIQDFMRDITHGDADDVLAKTQTSNGKELQVVSGRHAHLAALSSGSTPPELATLLNETLENVHLLKGAALAKFSGDASVFDSLRPDLEACLREQRQDAATSRDNTKAWLAIGTAAALALAAAIVAFRSDARWRDFLRRLSAEPGIAIMGAHHGWFSPSRVAGLRDPLAADPQALAKDAGLDPARIRFAWNSYFAIDAASMRKRFAQRFSLPDGVRVTVANGIAEIGGSAPYEWLERVRHEATLVPGINEIAERDVTVTYDPALVLQRFQAAFPPPPEVAARFENGTLHLAGKTAYEWIAPVREGATKLPGINAISEQELEVAFDPALVLKRFESRFGLPDSVSAAMQNGALKLSGEASHAWLTRVRKGATEVPGVASLADHDLTDLDQQTFQQSKSVIESAFVYFLVNKDNFATEGFAALSRLPDEIRRCQTAAKRLGADISIEIRGSADSVGTEAKNIDLSQRRANAVRDFLVSCGLDSEMLKPLALGAPSAAGADAKPLPEQSDRRVAFRIITPQ